MFSADAAEFDSAYHAPVLVEEVVELLREADHVLDGTLGGGGHAAALLEHRSASREVIGIDRDPEAIASALALLAAYAVQGRFTAYLGNYATLDDIPELQGRVFGGILLDLGISSHQIDSTVRGFSFRAGAPLDMRMGPDVAATAADFLNAADEVELAHVFREYADEPRGFRLAREIVRRRTTRAFATSDDLVGAIRGAFGPRTGPADFARLFQAVRIALNDELSALRAALPKLRDRLLPAGVLAVIAYHSGEDRLVKHAFREWSAACVCPPRQPVCLCRGESLGDVITRKPITASPTAAGRNPRARSARLRAWRKAA